MEKGKRSDVKVLAEDPNRLETFGFGVDVSRSGCVSSFGSV